jgi:hypothetical protein
MGGIDFRGFDYFDMTLLDFIAKIAAFVNGRIVRA